MIYAHKEQGWLRVHRPVLDVTRLEPRTLGPRGKEAICKTHLYSPSSTALTALRGLAAINHDSIRSSSVDLESGRGIQLARNRVKTHSEDRLQKAAGRQIVNRGGKADRGRAGDDSKGPAVHSCG